ncbi:hypothetical protein [Pedobacter deserti]|uniref:hypothetical protein n=1 Tax=Pedobacter deserti TaxID=2817382 RepID=UPI00210AE17B|nr:hypothetical protein [Pedobacter sp. SYSU D00382]
MSVGFIVRPTFAQEDVHSADSSIAQVRRNLALLPREKIYLHTDKHAYQIGDTLWFKAYVVDASNYGPSNTSKLLFLEFYNERSDMVSRQSVEIKQGLGFAQIAIDSAIFSEGTFSLYAYTHWTNNFSTEHAFSKSFYIGKPSQHSWFINSDVRASPQGGREQLDVALQVKDVSHAPIGLRDVHVKLMSRSPNIPVVDEKIKTDREGKLNFSYKLNRRRKLSNFYIELQDISSGSPGYITKLPLMQLERNSEIDLQFLPEGGKLINGLPAVVAFKAVNVDGKAVDLAGEVYNEAKRQVATFTSSHDGMGKFMMVPDIKTKYTVKITKPLGVSQTFELPAIAENGLSMQVDVSDPDTLKVCYNVSAQVLANDGDLSILGTLNGVFYYQQKLDTKKTSVMIDKKLFPTGIARIVMLYNGRPLAERAVFINHHDQLRMKYQLSITGNGLKLTVKDKDGNPVMGQFSVAVTNGRLTKPDTSGSYDLVTHFLLSSELKGKINNPGYYIKGGDKVAGDLDLLMLTQGWTDFEWKDLERPAVRKVEPDTSTRIVDVKYLAFTNVQDLQVVPRYVNLQPGLSVAIPVGEEDRLNLTGNFLQEVNIKQRKKRDYSGHNRNGVGFADVVLDSVDIVRSKAIGLYQLLSMKVPDLKIERRYLKLENRSGYALKIGDRWVTFWANDLSGKFGRNPWLFLGDTPQALKDKLNVFDARGLSLIEVMYSQKYLHAYNPSKIPQQFTHGHTRKTVEAFAKAGVPAPLAQEEESAIIELTYSRYFRPDPNPMAIVFPRKFFVPRFQDSDSVSGYATLFWEPRLITDQYGNASLTLPENVVDAELHLSVQGIDVNGRLASYFGIIRR